MQAAWHAVERSAIADPLPGDYLVALMIVMSYRLLMIFTADRMQGFIYITGSPW